MMNPEFPARLYKKGDEPEPQRSINHHSRMMILSKLETALHRDEWEYLCNSPLGVFIKFYKLKFCWSSRLVHYMLTSQLVCGKNYEIWCLIGAKPVRFSLHEFERLTGLNCEYIENIEDPPTEVTEEMKEFWDKLGVHVDDGPSVVSLIKACEVCESWTREERIKLGYLSIYASFIDAHDRRLPTRVGMARLVMDVAAFERYPWGRVAFKKLITSVKMAELTNCSYVLEGFVHVLQVWIYHALPDFGAKYGRPVVPTSLPIILSYKGCSSRGLKNLRAELLKQKRVQYFELKEYEEMFPLWDDEKKDEKIRNIVKAVFGEFGDWTFTSAHWSEGCDKSSKVVIAPNKKRNIDMGEERRQKKKTSVSTEEGMILALGSLKNHFDACLEHLDTLTKRVEAVELIMEERKEGRTVAADRDHATNCITWKQQKVEQGLN